MPRVHVRTRAEGDPLVRARNLERGATPAHEEAKRRGRDSVSRQVSAFSRVHVYFVRIERFESVIEFSKAIRHAVISTRQRSGAPRVSSSATSRNGRTVGHALLEHAARPNGFEVFVDTQSTDGAAEISDLLKKRSRSATCSSACSGSRSMQSKWVRQEIQYAAKAGKPMVPIVPGGVQRAPSIPGISQGFANS